MQTLHVKPFSKEKLIEELYSKFAHRKVQTNFGTVQVRTSGFTITGNVALKLNPEKGIITTRTSADTVFVYLIFCLPLFIYILAKKSKTKALEDEVMAGLKDILEPVDQLS